MTETPKKRIDELDALRGLAALGIVFCHLFDSYDHYFGHSFDVPGLFRYFALAVHLFFIVSGFVIFMTLNRVKHPMDFVVSRLSRLYPVYWIAIAITFSTVVLFGQPTIQNELGVSSKAAIANFSMLQGFVRIAHVDRVYWTLTLELAFYAWMFMWFVTRQLCRIHWICAAWVLFGIGWHLVSPTESFATKALAKFCLVEYCYLFAAGIMFYKVWSGTANRVTYGILALCYGAAWIIAPTIDACVIGVFFGLFFLLMQGHMRFLSSRPLLFLGAISYSLYLIHQNIGYIVIRYGYDLGLHPLISITAAIAVTILIATAMNKWVEIPAMRAVRRLYKEGRGIFAWLPSSSGATAPAANLPAANAAALATTSGGEHS